MIHTKSLVVLETMWGGSGNAPGLFHINPHNHSGKRLIYLIGHEDFWVTNACREYVKRAKQHGSPDPKWLAENLQRLTYDLLLVCGKVAQHTYRMCEFNPDCKVVEIPHPAARNWTKSRLEYWKKELSKC